MLTHWSYVFLALTHRYISIWQFCGPDQSHSDGVHSQERQQNNNAIKSIKWLAMSWRCREASSILTQFDWKIYIQSQVGETWCLYNCKNFYVPVATYWTILPYQGRLSHPLCPRCLYIGDLAQDCGNSSALAMWINHYHFLTYKQLETHWCTLSTVATDALVLNIHCFGPVS